MVEVISTLVLKFWVNLVEYSPRYSHSVSVSVYMYLSVYTLYLCLLSKNYNFNHAVYL